MKTDRSKRNTPQTKKKKRSGAPQEPDQTKCSECNTTLTLIWGTQSKCSTCYFIDRTSNGGGISTTPLKSKASTPTNSSAKNTTCRSVLKMKKLFPSSSCPHSDQHPQQTPPPPPPTSTRHQQQAPPHPPPPPSTSTHQQQQTPPPPPPPPPSTSTHHQQQTPLPTPMATIRLSSEDKHCLVVSNDFISSQDKLFQLMPQNPHLQPLEKYPPSAIKGMKHVFDLDFTNLAEKLQESVDPVEFNAKAGDYTWQLNTLEEMGYNVVKLKEKFDKLCGISVKRKAKRDEIGETREKIRVVEAQESVRQRRIEDLKKEVQQMEADLRIENEEVETMKLQERELSKETANTLNAFKSVATAPWA